MSTPSITLDPGHGGHDSGAVGPGGTKESDVALADALMLRDELRRHGVTVCMTRTDDTFVGLSERADMANSWGTDLFLSLHCNSFERPSAWGFEVFTSPGDTGADPFATELFDAYEFTFPDRPARKDLSDGDPDKEARFGVLTQTRMPAALFELGFISNPDGERWLNDEDARGLRVMALVNGILAHLDMQRGIEPEPEPDPGTTNLADVRDRLEVIAKAAESGIKLLT